jgi:endonuclease/exonuclease/phosphatase family metal-dependent hydrolase
MQEVFNADFEVPSPDRMFNILSLLKEASGLEYVYFSKRSSTDIAGGTAPYGNAILSRYPFVSTDTIQIENSVVEHMTIDNEVKNGINLQIVQIEEGGHTWTIANHHGHHEPDPDGNEDSIRAMARVAEVLKEYVTAAPLVLCGDLNVQPTSPVMRVFDGWLDDVITKSGAISTLTGINVARDIVCDHILINDKVNVRHFNVSDEIVSDHCPVVIEVEGR